MSLFPCIALEPPIRNTVNFLTQQHSKLYFIFLFDIFFTIPFVGCFTDSAFGHYIYVKHPNENHLRGCEFSKILLSVRYLLLTWPLCPPNLGAAFSLHPRVLKQRRIFTQRCYFSTASSWSCSTTTNQPHLTLSVFVRVDRGLADSWPLSKSNNQPRGVTQHSRTLFLTCALTFLLQFFVIQNFISLHWFLILPVPLGKHFSTFKHTLFSLFFPASAAREIFHTPQPQQK